MGQCLYAINLIYTKIIVTLGMEGWSQRIVVVDLKVTQHPQFHRSLLFRVTQNSSDPLRVS